MLATVGNRVQVQTRQEFEKLLALATSVRGWYDHDLGEGEVFFATQEAAQAARREVD